MAKKEEIVIDLNSDVGAVDNLQATMGDIVDTVLNSNADQKVENQTSKKTVEDTYKHTDKHTDTYTGKHTDIPQRAERFSVRKEILIKPSSQNALEKIKEQTGQSINYLINKAIEDFIAEHTE